MYFAKILHLGLEAGNNRCIKLAGTANVTTQHAMKHEKTYIYHIHDL